MNWNKIAEIVATAERTRNAVMGVERIMLASTTTAEMTVCGVEAELGCSA